MSATFDEDTAWFNDAKKQLKTDLELGLLNKDQYKEKINMLWDERKEDSFY